MKIKKRCESCGVEYIKMPNMSKKYWETRKYCSFTCASQQKKGCAPWNKGTHGIMKSWNKGQKTPSHVVEKLRKAKKLKGKEHTNWKGDGASYSSIHSWVNRNKKRKNECTFCGKKGNNYQIHWSNIDHAYKRNLDDYRELCVPCHKKYDLKNGLCDH